MAKKGRPRKQRLSEEEFVLRAIHSLRRDSYKGIHAVYSGFNEAFRQYYGEDADPVMAVNRLVAKGKIVSVIRRGGAVIYDASELSSEEKRKLTASGRDKGALKQILGD